MLIQPHITKSAETKTEKLPKTIMQMYTLDREGKRNKSTGIIIGKHPLWKKLRIAAFVMLFIAVRTKAKENAQRRRNRSG